MFRVPCLTFFPIESIWSGVRCEMHIPYLGILSWMHNGTLTLIKMIAWNIPWFHEIKMCDCQALNERKMQLSLTFLSWQDGKPLEPVTAVTAGWGGDLLLPAIQPAAGSSTETSQSQAGLSTPTQRNGGDFRMAGASLGFTQQTQMLLAFFHAPGWGRQGWNRRNSTLQQTPPFSSLRLLALMQFLFLHNIQCRIKTYDDKTPIFKTTAEAVAFQKAQLLSGASGWWARWSQAVSRNCFFDLSKWCSSQHSCWAWPGVPKTL